MGRDAVGRQSVASRSGRLGVFGACLLALCIGSAGCGDDPKPKVTVTPGDDVGLDVPTGDDADVVEGEEDADVDEESDADVPETPDADAGDEGDADVEDEDGGVEDEDGGVEDEEAPPAFLDSCIFPVLSCLGEDPEAVSCTYNPQTGEAEAGYGAGRGARWARDGENRFVFEAFLEGELCYSAQALDERQEPFEWEVTSGGEGAERFGVERVGGLVEITCPDDSTETYRLDEVGAYLPNILEQDEEPCRAIGAPRCEETSDCAVLDDAFECCDTAGTSRCLVPNQCPGIPAAPPELDSCLTELLECFGTRHVPTACSIDLNDGVTEIDYTRERRAVITTDGFDNYTVETANQADLCYLARMSGDRPWESVAFVDPDTSAEYSVSFDGAEARVTCADATEEVQSTDAILQYIPFFLDEQEPLCEVEAIDECDGDEDCGAGLCCETLEGPRCLAVESCPEVQDPWDTSCLRPLFECFGANQALAVCVDYQALDITTVAYVSGSRATYFLDGEQEVRRTSREQEQCFEAVAALEPGGGFEVLDLGNDDRYLVAFDGDTAQITCADQSTEEVPRSRIESYLPARPSELQCDQPVRDDLCGVGDLPECGDGLECCDIGDRNVCLVEGSCEFNQPRQACTDEAQCNDGELCCELSPVRVCDPRQCGNGQLCCTLESGSVCATEDVCNRQDECDPGDPNTCEQGQLCCATNDGTRCLDNVDVCPDDEDPWTTSCMFGTFECQGTELLQTACFEDADLDVTQVEYEGGERILHYVTSGQQGRRSSVGGQPCFNAIETDEGTLEVEDLLTGERFVVSFEGGTASINCVDAERVDEVPATDVLDYLPQRPLQGSCDAFERNDLCDVEEDCGDGEVCCNLGTENVCLTAEACEDSAPRRSCGENADCVDGEVCCTRGPVNLCDPLVCGDAICCTELEAQVCATEAECNRVDECDPLDLDSCVDGELCCDTDLGNRCLNTGVCPDPQDPVGTSCAANVLSCFGEDNELAQCADFANIGIIEAEYISGSTATFFTSRGQAAVRTGNADGDCYQLLGDQQAGFELFDLLGQENYAISVEGPEATISCPGDVTSVVPLSALTAFLPQIPEAELCEPGDNNSVCDGDLDCAEGLTCCDIGDRRACLSFEDCLDSAPRQACSDDAQCAGEGEVCCTFARPRVCDPVVCDGELCCDLPPTSVCGQATECLQQVFDECEEGDPEACEEGVACCPTLNGTRCLTEVDGECPGPLEGTCLQNAFECQGPNPEFAQCVLRTDPDQIEADYVNGVNIVFSDLDGPGQRLVSRDGAGCFTALGQQGGYEVRDLETDETILLDINNDQVIVSCEDASVAAVPLAFVQDFLPDPPPQAQCTSPEREWQESCLFSLFECSGADLTQEACVEYDEIVDRTEVTYSGGVEAFFFNREGQPVVRTSSDQLPCFEAEVREGGYDVRDLLGAESYAVDFIDGRARITCPDDSVDTVDAAFVDGYVPERPPQGVCDAAERGDECQQDVECGDGLVCCNLGVQNVCLTAESCFENEPQPTCEVDDDCAEGEFCCAREPVGVCDFDLCGDQLCCQQPSAQVCGTADECNGVIDLCSVDDPASCPEGALCCDTLDGARCIEGDACPQPPDPIDGSCAALTLQCFGRGNVLDSCVDFGDIDRVEASYVSGATATFFTSFGVPARRAGFGQEVVCFDAFETEGGGFDVVDLNTGERFGVAFDGPSALVTCPDETVETYAADALETYFPTRPLEGCGEPVRDNECEVNADCAELDPSFECCDGGDRNICVASGTCQANTAHATCGDADDCGQGEECCALGGVRVCDPTLCGPDEVCCTVFQEQVCGSNRECNTFQNVCDFNNDENNPGDNCPEGSLCCPTNNGTRCFGIEDEVECPPVEDLWPASCLFDVVNCGGANIELAQCVDLGEARISASYDDGTQIVYATVDGERTRRVSRGGEECYEAIELVEGNGGFQITDLGDNAPYAVRFNGDNAEITCSDDTILNVPRGSVEAHFPAAPAPGLCQDPLAGWQGSCLFPLFECFGDANEDVEACLDYGDLNFASVTYTTGNAATFFEERGVPTLRTRDFNQQPCFRAAGDLDSGFEIADLLSGEGFRLEVQGDLARITCPDETVVDVQAALPLAYLPQRPAPDACEAFERNDLCQADNECADGFVCCDLGDQNLCTTRDTCERSRPRPTCDNNEQCGVEGAQCCAFGPTIICDPDVCGDQPCCSVNEANICASEAECDGIFDLCDLDDPDTCAQGEICCATAEGNQCLVGNECPPPPDPLAGTCLFDLFQCFGRNLTVDRCLDYGDLNMTEVAYDTGQRAVYYQHRGQAARIAGDDLFYCFEALELEDGLQIRDLDNGDVYNVVFDGNDALIQCPDATQEASTVEGVNAYLPERPDAGLCQAPVRDDECQVNADCAELDPQLVCCDTGDRNACLGEDTCARNQVRPTCAESPSCGEGTECCELLTTRVCDPSLCGEQLCCNVVETSVCGTSEACNEIVDVCEVGNNATCPDGRVCCDSNIGARCVVDDGQECPPVEDLWPTSCLFEVFECFGADNAFAACFDTGNGGPTEVTFAGGARARYFTDGGQDALLAGNALRDCFTAVATDDAEGGFAVTSAEDGQNYGVRFVGDAAQITCPDQSVVNTTRQTIETYLPPRPDPLQCESAEQQWQQSCLFGTFECFGAEQEVDVCADFTGLGVQRVGYVSGAEGTHFVSGGAPAFRTVGADAQSCFEIFSDRDNADLFRVQDLTTGESFTLRYDETSAIITCPDETVQTVLRANVDAYLPEIPEPCAPAEREDECQLDADCQDPQLVCCDTGDRNTCLTRDDCARSAPREACVGAVEGELVQGNCAEGSLCCETGPVRICDPSVCGGEVCCSFEEAAVCGNEVDCAGIVDVCTLGDDATCAPGEVCCPGDAGTQCLVGDECPERENGLLLTCLGPMLECFGPREYESCQVYEGFDRIDAAYSLSGEFVHFTRNGSEAWQTISNGLPCYVAAQTEDGFEFVDSQTGDAVSVSVEGDNVLLTCPDAQVQAGLLVDLTPFVPERPDPQTCVEAPRDDQCAVDADCDDPQLVCCAAGDRNLCTTAEDCFRATPRPTCGEDADCGEGTTCCEMDPQRVCDPVLCDGQACCDLVEALVCGSADDCAGVFDTCAVEDPEGCLDGELCCATDAGNRCLVGNACPDEPDPIENTCLVSVFGCAERDEAVDSCVYYGDTVGQTDAIFLSGNEASFLTRRGQSVARVGDGISDCFEATSVEGGVALTDLDTGDLFTVLFNGEDALITCADLTEQAVESSAVLRYLPTAPDPQTCAAAPREDLCQVNTDCLQGEVCCDTGLQNQCLSPSECVANTPRPLCVVDEENPDPEFFDPSCAEGTICCELALGRICDPSVCPPGEVCCTLNEAPVCATTEICGGIFDACSDDDPTSCAQGEVCCPTEDGARCLVGGECPEQPDEVQLSCIGSTLDCFGKAPAFVSCEDYGDFDRTEVLYEDNVTSVFFRRGVNEARRALNSGISCFDAVETGEGFEVRDLALGEDFSVAINGETAVITCQDGVSTEFVPTDVLRLYLPERPAANLCAPAQREDECQNDGECGDPTLGCCDVGDRNLCLTSESCTRNQPVAFCAQDDECAEGEFCCEQTDVRICDPAVCGNEQACCTVTSPACGSERRCNGIVDLCDTLDPNSCGQGENCCETAEGNRCLVGDSCPEPPDPVLDTCLGATLSCFGRDKVQLSCVDYTALPSERLEVTYDNDALGVFFTRRGLPGLRATASNGEVQCFNALTTEDGEVRIQEFGEDENGPFVLEHLVTFEGPQAQITCADQAQFSVPASAVTAYLGERPEDIGQCSAPPRDNDECQDDGECGQGTICCDNGLANVCLAASDCLVNTPRPVCELDELDPDALDPSCAQGTVCCDRSPARVCDPVLCGAEVCCTVEESAVCATASECAGFVDDCALDNPSSCAEGSLCCSTEDGNRCLEGDECPDAPDPILDTCLADALGCFGRDNVLDVCTDHSPLDRTDATYVSGSRAIYYDDLTNRASSRTSNGLVDCYDAVDTGAAIEIADILNGVTHQVEVIGDTAVITCADLEEFFVPAADFRAYFSERPDPLTCDPPVRNDECVNDAECGELDPTLVCCNVGDRNECAGRDGCVLSQPRETCLDDGQCGPGEVCCERAPVRVCDPSVCGFDQVCCDVESADICATQEECNGIIDLCQADEDCAQGEVCCDTLEGNQCLVGDSCPGLPDPLAGSCIEGTLGCFGLNLDVSACTFYDGVGIAQVSYDNNATATYYTRDGDAVRLTTAEGPVNCYDAIQLDGGGFQVLDLNSSEAYQIVFDGDAAQITCPDNTVEDVTVAGVLAYMPSQPPVEACQEAERDDQCQTNSECQALDPQLVCCDSGLANECLPADACPVFESPRATCDEDLDCGDGEVCCELSPVRVCDPGLCGEELCCTVESEQVCATEAECGGIFDHCDPNVADACAQGSVCCPTDLGNRCLVGDECPAPPDPIANSCLAGALLCFGADNTFESCVDTGSIGVIEASYAGSVSAQFFTQFGRPARRTYLDNSPCFNATEDSDGNIQLVDALTQESFQIAITGNDAVVTCADDSTETVPADAFRAYFPDAPSSDLCEDFVRQDDCQVDADCVAFGVTSVCCDTGQANVCTDRQACQELTPRDLCNNDGECGEGVGCCEREITTVCDPIVCNGRLCCDVVNRSVCGGSPEACLVGQSCLGDTLSCFGEDNVLEQCFDYGEDIGVLLADYTSGASALYYESGGRPGRNTRFDVLPCFQAVELSNQGGYELLNLQTGQNFQINYAGEDAQVTCADLQLETLPRAAVDVFFPTPPDAQACQPAERDDQCDVDGDCADLGPDAVCCDTGVLNECLPGVDCADFVPQPTCSVNADCPAGTGCCAFEGVRICDPSQCGDQICCNVPTADVCDAACLLCDSNADCDEGSICCSFTGSCTAPEECVPEPDCDTDADCPDSLVCCKAGQTPSCVVPTDCPGPCRSEDDCNDGQICCGSQGSPYGAHCSPPQQCGDDDNIACSANADCGNGELCCRTLDVPACVAEGDCPVACVADSDCGNGQECCGDSTRTPVCVPQGSCQARLGESCAANSDCVDGLTCCEYDDLGTVCMDADFCGEQVPALDCGDDTTVCDAFPLAACCSVNGAPVCSTRLGCDDPFFTCAEDVDCGPSGFECCENQNGACIAWAVGSCEGGDPF